MKGFERPTEQRFPETSAPIRAAHAQDRDVAPRGVFARPLLRANVPGELVSLPGDEPKAGVELWRVEVMVAEVLVGLLALTPVVGERFHVSVVELLGLFGEEAANADALDLTGRGGWPAKSTRRSSKRRTSR